MNPNERAGETLATQREADDPEFRRILADLLEAMEEGKPAAADRIAREHPAHAPALLQSALYAEAAASRMRNLGDSVPDSVAEAGMRAAFRRLGFVPSEISETDSNSAPRPAGIGDGLPPQSLLAARQDRGWSLAELARRLSLPAGMVLKLEQGRIVSWPERLAARLADALETTRERAESILTATGGSHRAGALAFSASGDPEVAAVQRNRRETLDFEEALAKERLTPEQAAIWREGL